MFIFLGLGVFAVAIQQFGMFAMRKREKHTEWLIAELGREDEKQTPANVDAPDSGKKD